MTSRDYPTFNFLQWYVAEQHEEEKLFKSVIDKLTLAGKSGEGLYFIDKELATLDAQNYPRAATVRVAALLMSADLIFCGSKTFLSGNKFAFFL